MKTILSGYRILDLTDEKGMLCSRLLADMGADVIMIERPGKPHLSRQSARFRFPNAGKRSIVLDPGEPSGRENFENLISQTDVLVESESPGYLDGLGFGYGDLSKINPKLIVASITGFGQNGPYRDYKVSDLVASALGGSMYVSGEPDSPPLKLFGEQAYNTACLFAANGIMLALMARPASGKGQRLDISIMECVAATLDHVLPRRFYGGEVARRQGSLYWNCAFRVLPCRDGYIVLTLLHQWDTLVEWLDSEGMAADLTDEQWKNRDVCLENIDHIIEVLGKWALSHTAAELVEKGQLMRFPWAKVNTIPELMASPQVAGQSPCLTTLSMGCPDLYE
ncbi:MAG: CoA transferase [Dehalococcoidales bacterium]|nr:CoA transferase [Dehalococcoidales bacterium]